MPRHLSSPAALIFVAVLLSSASVNAYPSGPPSASCLDQQPWHTSPEGKEGSTDLFPASGGPDKFAITVGSTTWNSGGTLSVTLGVTGTTKGFEGFVIKAVRASNGYTNDSLGPLLGSFVCTTSAGASSPPLYHSVYAPNGENNCVSHKVAGDDKYQTVSCTWTAPTTNEGPIMFSATVVTDYNAYQTQIQSAVIPNSLGNPSFSRGNDTLSSAPNTYGCGSSKTCALYPSGCDVRGGCRYGVIITPMASTNQLQFDFFGYTFDWLALALGDSTEMEDLEIVACGYDPKAKKVVMQFGFAPSKSFLPLYRSDITMMKTRYDSGVGDMASLPIQPNSISCQFVRPIDSSFTYYKYNKTTATSSVVNVTSKMSGQGRFAILAQGLNVPNTPNLGKHTHIPLRSPQRLAPMSGSSIVYFKGIEAYVQTHGTLMTIFWLFLCGLAIIVARHTRPVLTQELVKKQLWFLLHIACMVVGYIIALAGLIYVLVKNGEWESDSQTHGIFGIIGMSLGLINIIAGIFRPHPGTKHRPIFNRLHRWNGLLAMAFATVAIWLGATYQSLRPEFRFWAVIVLAIYTGLQIIFMVLFEGLRQRAIRNKRLENSISHRFELSDKSQSAAATSNGDVSAEPEPKIKGKQLVHINEGWLVVYACVFLALAAAFWAGLWVH